MEFEYTLFLLVVEFTVLVTSIILWFKRFRAKSASNSGVGVRIGQPILVKKLRVNYFRQSSKDFHRTASKTSSDYADVKFRVAAMNVPIPWGWPNYKKAEHKEDKPKLSHAMTSFLGCLVREKKLVSDWMEKPRTTNSLRALLEDRYGPVHKDDMNEITYRKVKAGLLRDPSEPYDQMDDFNHREAERVKGQLELLHAAKLLSRASRVTLNYSDLGTQNIKQPWGW